MEVSTLTISQLERFSDEILFEIFDRLSPTEVYKTFHGLNRRFSTILNDARLRFRDNISSMTLQEFHSYVTDVLPLIIDRLVSFRFGTYDTDEYQQVSLLLRTYSIDLSLCRNLRTLVIIKITFYDIPMLQLALRDLLHLVNIRILVDSNDVGSLSVVEINNDFFKSPRLKHVKMDMCSRTIFTDIDQTCNVEQLSIVWCQLQELTHLLQHTPNLSTLKATVTGLNNAEKWSEHISGTFTTRYSLRLKSLKLVVDSISFDDLLLFLHELIQLRSLWLLLNHQEYMHVQKWEHLFQSSLPKVEQLDLTIALIRPLVSGQFLMNSTPQEACNMFNTKFWFDRGWHARLDEYVHCMRLTVSTNILPLIKKARRE